MRVSADVFCSPYPRGPLFNSAVPTCPGKSKCRINLPRPKVRDFDACFRKPVMSLAEFVWDNPDSATGCVISVGQRPCASWIGSPISNVCFGIYVLFADTSLQNLSDFVLYMALCEGRARGCTWVNVGGSELESLFHFKAKAASRHNNSHMTRIVYDVKWLGPQAE